MNPDRFTLQADVVVDVAAAADGKARQPTFTIDAYNGGELKLGGFGRPVVIDLAGLRASDRTAALLEHDSHRVVGQSRRVTKTRDSLQLTGVVTGDVDNAESPAGIVVSHARRGFVWAASVGVNVDRYESVAEAVETRVNGRTFKGPILIARAGRLSEVSFVSSGADESATANIAGRSRPNMPTEPTTTENDAILAERRRIQEINKLCPGQQEELKARLVQDGTPFETAEREILRAEHKRIVDERPRLSIHSGSTAWSYGPGELKDVAGAAFLRLCGRAEAAAKLYGERAAEQADSLRCGSLVDLMAWSRMNLDHADIPRDSGELIRASGWTTAAFPNIVGGGLEKIALDAYRRAAPTWRLFANIVNVANFKSHTQIRVNFAGEYEQLGPGGEIKHGTISESTYAIQAVTRAKMFGLTREAIINDDLGLLTTIAEALGRMGAMAISQIVWTTILANAGSFFGAGNSNYLSGGTSVLDVFSLGDAIELLRKQTTAGGEPIDLQPRTVVVPPELEGTARQVLRSTMLERNTSSADNLPTANPIPPDLQLGVEPRISSTAYTGNSTTQWYVFGLPSDGCVSVAFLNGRQDPVVEQVEGGAELLGLWYRGYADFGVALGDPKAGVKSAGA